MNQDSKSERFSEEKHRVCVFPDEMAKKYFPDAVSRS